MRSVFRPVGTLPDGYWVEQTGGIELRLTVAIRDGGWYWQPRGTRIRGIAVPGWALPRTTAYKAIEDGRYRFHVGFSLPPLGLLLSYSGLLAANSAAAP